MRRGRRIGWPVPRPTGTKAALIPLTSDFATALLCALAALCHWRRWRRAYVVVLYSGAGALGLTGHFGGSLTHGSDYLTHYAPPLIKALLGRPSAGVHREAPRVRPAVFAAEVQPVLQARCGTCHNAQKHKGGLRVDSLDSLLRGEEDGPAMVAGNGPASLLIKRLLLPLEDEGHMPPQGNPQPKLAEVAFLSRWIDSGAQSNAVVGAHLRP